MFALRAKADIRGNAVPSSVDTFVLAASTYGDMRILMTQVRDITDMTADGRPSSFGFGIGGTPYSQ
jgi:hypothetical protein